MCKNASHLESCQECATSSGDAPFRSSPEFFVIYVFCWCVSVCACVRMVPAEGHTMEEFWTRARERFFVTHPADAPSARLYVSTTSLIESALYIHRNRDNMLRHRDDAHQTEGFSE